MRDVASALNLASNDVREQMLKTLELYLHAVRGRTGCLFSYFFLGSDSMVKQEVEELEFPKAMLSASD